MLKGEETPDASDLSPKDLARLRTGIQCDKCKRRFLSQNGYDMHHCRGEPMPDFREELSPAENKEMMEWLGIKGDDNCPACRGSGEVGPEDESEPCPVCRGA